MKDKVKGTGRTIQVYNSQFSSGIIPWIFHKYLTSKQVQIFIETYTG